MNPNFCGGGPLSCQAWAHSMAALSPHRSPAGVHACPAIVPLFDNFHLSIRSHIENRCVVQDVLWRGATKFLHELPVAHCCVLRICCEYRRKEGHDEK